MWELVASWGVVAVVCLIAVAVPVAAVAGPWRGVSRLGAGGLVIGGVVVALGYLALLAGPPVVGGTTCGTDTVDASHSQSWVLDDGSTLRSGSECVAASRLKFTAASLAVLLCAAAFGYVGTRDRDREPRPTPA